MKPHVWSYNMMNISADIEKGNFNIFIQSLHFVFCLIGAYKKSFTRNINVPYGFDGFEMQSKYETLKKFGIKFGYRAKITTNYLNIFIQSGVEKVGQSR